VSWLWVAAVALLLLAGLPRLAWGSPSQRALATGLCSAAVGLTLELDGVEALLAGAGWGRLGTLLQCLSVTLGAAAALGMARQVSPTPLRPQISPAVAGLPVAALQCGLFWLADVPDGPATGRFFADHGQQPAVLALWLVTVAAAVAAGAVLLPVLSRYAPGLELRRARFAVECTVAGLAVVGIGGLAMGVELGARLLGRPEVSAVAVMGNALTPIGLAVVALGVLIGRLLTAVFPLVRWLSAHLALRRLNRLAGELVAAAPEWGVSTVEDHWAVRNPAGQLYRRVIAIRDAGWTLLGLVDNAVISRANEFARARAGFAGEDAVAALAEACWLRYAVRARQGGATPPHADPAHFPERIPEPAGSLHEEAAFLVAVARMWRHPLVEEFLRGCSHEDDCAQLRSA
jgi:hypothetical protein